MGSKPQVSREYFRALRIIFFALIAGQVMFGLVAVFINQAADYSEGLQDLKMILLILVCAFSAGGYLGGRILFKNRMNSAMNQAGIIEKMNNYRAALVVRYALLEGPSLFAIVAFLITGDYTFLAIAGFLMIIFITLIPSKSNAIRDLELDPGDEQKILDPDAVISEMNVS